MVQTDTPRSVGSVTGLERLLSFPTDCGEMVVGEKELVTGFPVEVRTSTTKKTTFVFRQCDDNEGTGHLLCRWGNLSCLHHLGTVALGI